MTPTAFQLHVPESAITDLRERLVRTRFPDQAPGDPWAYGTDLAWMRELTAYWLHQFDWRAQEARLNAWPQFKVQLAGIDLHFLHALGVGPRPMPLLLSHGWPGSVFEFVELIPRLTDPARFGGDPVDAFTVVAPSLPGYGLSFAPGQARFSVEQIAEALASLMSEVLGHRRFATQGGDWGASVSARLGLVHPEKTIGVHLNLLPLRRDPAALTGDDPAERQYRTDLKRWLSEETGYSMQQGTRPQTLAFALTDSPVGLAAWIAEKMRAWSDCKGDIESAFSKDEILANVSLYWFTGAIGSSFWPYYARQHGSWPIPDGATVNVPMGYCEFPKEIVRPPRSLAARTFTDIRRWSVMPAGGHFAAMEEPDALATEIRAFYRPLRAG
ncbi:epoxide hydrolase [Variovorax sp. J22R24]|uniref:epoxide hydrolase family protein n=1 Tax=Variovorax gracilis TaxID=3053502 RepID=UPI0025754BB7|nr:epoxide hydrolase family protein [Variovorax sp. J22R24]MDM0109224.1 epoxide hydrolase [Variovorax sp. J22R24]